MLSAVGSRDTVDVALNPLQELVGVPGIDVVGPFPAELQQRTTFAAATMTGTAHADAARELGVVPPLS